MRNKQSKHPLCQFLIEKTGKSISKIAKEAGIDPRVLWKICKEERTGPTFYKLVGVVPYEILEKYIEKRCALEEKREKENLRKAYEEYLKKISRGEK